MKRFLPIDGTFCALALAAALPLFAPPAHAQVPIAAPPSWKAETKADGTRTFTPPDLQPGEVYRFAAYLSILEW